jgi:hypothetical protein
MRCRLTSGAAPESSPGTARAARSFRRHRIIGAAKVLGAM